VQGAVRRHHAGRAVVGRHPVPMPLIVTNFHLCECGVNVKTPESVDFDFNSTLQTAPNYHLPSNEKQTTRASFLNINNGYNATSPSHETTDSINEDLHEIRPHNPRTA